MGAEGGSELNRLPIRGIKFCLEDGLKDGKEITIIEKPRKRDIDRVQHTSFYKPLKNIILYALATSSST